MPSLKWGLLVGMTVSLLLIPYRNFEQKEISMTYGADEKCPRWPPQWS